MENLKIDRRASHEEAERDREAIRKAAKKITHSRTTARDFLQRAGIITSAGQLKKGYR